MLESILLVSSLPRKLVILPPSNVSKSAIHLSVSSRLNINFKRERAAETFEPMPMTIYGVVGTISVRNNNNSLEYFIGLITKASKVSVVQGNIVYRVDKVSFYCINHGDYEKVDPKVVVDELDMLNVAPNHPVSGISRLLSSGSFYFSNTFDLSRNLNERNSVDRYDLENSNWSFIWNRMLISDLLNAKKKSVEIVQSEINASGMLVLLIQGFVDFFSTSFIGEDIEMESINETASKSDGSSISGMKNSIKVGVISRLSCERAGTRFNARGVDEKGNVSNFVESEFLIFAHDTINSFVQLRGSIPLFWEQTGVQMSHAVTITKSHSETFEATKSHFQKLVSSYKSISILNLLNLTPTHSEYELKCAFSEMVTAQQDFKSSIYYHEFDYHHIVGRNNFSRLDDLYNEIENYFQQFGFTEYDVENKSIKQIQQGVFRTNCLDCLDRTNVVQSFLAKKHLIRILKKRNINPVNQEMETLDSLFNNLCADNGDWLSLIYAGTKALKSSATRHGRLTLSGLLDDGVKSVTRLPLI